MESTERARILVVDDNALNRKLLFGQLEAYLYSVSTVEGGPQALSILDAEQFDLVVLDVMMPDMDGYEVLQEIRKKWSSLELPVIMATSRDNSEDIIKALNYGANDYVIKPIDIAVAVARIATHLVLRQISQDLRTSEERLSLALNGTSEGIWDWDLIKDTIFYSDRWKTILGFSPQEIEGTPEEWFSRMHPDELDSLKAAIDDHLKGKSPNLNMEHRLLNKDGQYIWAVSRGVAIFDENGEPTRFAGSMSDVTEDKTFDPLTGLPNQLVFDDRLARSIGYAGRGEAYDYAVLLLDLSAHARISANLGPVASEAFLVESASRFSDIFFSGDDLSFVSPEDITVTRTEGAGYAVLLENLVDTRDASRVAERVCEAFENPFSLSDQEVYSNVSIGIAVASPHYIDYSDVMRDAGVALDRARTVSGSHVDIYDPDMHQRALEQIQLEADLRRAIDNDELFLNCQPVINMKTGAISGFEALVRWQRGDHGTISPGVFIPLAEQIGMVDTIDDWVMREACNFQQELISHGLPAIDVAVNLSVSELENTDLEARVDKLLASTGIDPSLIEMEVTESIFMEDIDAIVNLLQRLSKRGIRFSIDDFGTGYSSLAYLRRLPVSVLKIDQSFIRDVVSKDAGAKSIVSSIISMAHKLGLEVIAEGIEELEQSDFLVDEECDRAQGFYFGRPLTKDDFTNALREQASNGRTPMMIAAGG